MDWDKFDDEGYVTEEEWKRLESGRELSGDDALMWLAEVFSGATHGNYPSSVLLSRSAEDLKGLEIRVKKSPGVKAA